MIVFDLTCRQRHVFEGWFGSSDDFAAQRGRGLVACPICDDSEVEKAVMAPRLSAGESAVSERRDMPSPEFVKAMLGKLAEAQAKALEKSDFVGQRFAEEARAIHFGETPQRTIHGQATIAQAEALAEEGVKVSPLPFPVRPPSTDN